LGGGAVGYGNKDVEDFVLTTLAKALVDDRHILCDHVVDNVLHFLQDRIRSDIETHIVHNELKEVLDVCSCAMNVSWVIGKGEWADVPDTDAFKWLKANFEQKVMHAWHKTDYRADMLKAALCIDWKSEPYSAALNDLRVMWGLFDDVPIESVLRFAIWHKFLIWGGEVPEEIARVPDWQNLAETARSFAEQALRDRYEGEIPDVDEGFWSDNAEDFSWLALNRVHELIKERMPSLGLGPDDFAKRKLSPPLIDKDSYTFDEMVLIYKTLDKCDERRSRENCLYDVWAMSFGTDALMKSVYDALEKYAENVHKFLVPIGKPAYFVCIPAMREVELGWKRLIRSVLRRQFGDEDKAWNDGVPESIRIAAATLAERRKGQDSKWDCLYIVDLKTILDRNWKLVEPKIASRKRFEKKCLMESLDRLNEIRNDLSHPKEGQTFKYADELDGYLKDMAQFTKEVLREQGKSERETENA